MDVFHDWCRSYLGRERTRRSRSGDVEHGRREEEERLNHHRGVEQPRELNDEGTAVLSSVVECTTRREKEVQATTAQEGGEYSTWTLRVEQQEGDWSHRVKKSKRNLAVGSCHNSHTYSVSSNKYVSEGSECTTRDLGGGFVESDDSPGNRERTLVNAKTHVQSATACCCCCCSNTQQEEEKQEELFGNSLGCPVEDRMSSGPPSPFDVPSDFSFEAPTGVNERIAAGQDTTTAENSNGSVSTSGSKQQQPGVKVSTKYEKEGGPLYSKASTFPTSARKNHVAVIIDEIQRGVMDSSCPPHGAKSVMGRRAKMEDTFVAIPNLLQVAFADSMNEIIPPRIAEQIEELIKGGVPEQESAPSMSELRRASTMRQSESGKEVDRSLSLVQSTKGKLMEEKIHFFGVFDGHGGAAAAHHCREIMHERLKEALLSTCFVLEETKSAAIACSSEAFSKALEQAFKVVDEEFASMSGDADELSLVGTTAVVTLLSSKSMYVANAGDSRAVLYRNGKAMALTDDHKAAREDETARVEAAGGQILFWNGVRVMGLLAVSRAIGDHSLRPYVIADPEVTVVNRHQGDELLVMASDGLWDVISNQEACALAKKCLLRARQKGSSRENAARVAATVLTRAAVDRGSRDNVTVLVIDLMQYPDDLLEADALKMRLSDEIGFAPEEKSSGEGASGEEDSKVSADDTVPVPPTSITFDSPFDDSPALDADDVDLGPRQSFKSPFEMMDGPRDSTQW